MRLVIDPGHGGDDDRGTCDLTFIEAEYNLDFCNYLHATLEHTGWPIRPFLTRDGDAPVSLDDRAEFAARVPADLAISIHVNSSKDPTLHGMLAFFWPGDSLCKEICRTIVRAAPTPLFRRGSKSWFAATHESAGDWLQRPRNVLAPHTQRNRRAILIELGYRSHPWDREFLLSPHGPQGMVAAILAGLATGLHEKGAGTWT